MFFGVKSVGVGPGGKSRGCPFVVVPGLAVRASALPPVPCPPPLGSLLLWSWGGRKVPGASGGFSWWSVASSLPERSLFSFILLLLICFFETLSSELWVLLCHVQL